MSFPPYPSKGLGNLSRLGRHLALVSLAVLLMVLLPALPARATGGDIQVISDDLDVKFPGGLAFSLTAEADAEIVEVRLLFRTLDNGTWSYAYPTFQRGSRITASLDLNSTGNIYLPPGTRLEYYYVIRDSLGNEHRTSPTVFEYTDTRFQWEQTQIGPLVLSHYNLSESRVSSVAQQVEPELERIAGLLPVHTEGSMKGIIYNRRAHAEEAFPFQSQTISEQHVLQGFAFPASGVFVALGLQPRVIVHETAHLMLEQALGPSALPIPAWLDEGFASYVEPGSTAYSGRSLSSRGLPLRAMSTQPGKPRDIATFYLKAESVVTYLIDAHGAESFRSFLGELRQGYTVGEALMTTYGFNVQGLETRWTRGAGGPAAPAPMSRETPSPFLYFDAWILGGLALLVLALVVGRYLMTKLRPAELTEDRLQPWEYQDTLHTDDDEDYPR